MTDEEIKQLGYTEMYSPAKGKIFLKQNGTVLYFKDRNELQLPSGIIIKNPTVTQLKNEYAEYIQFPKIQGCLNCTTKK